MSRFARVARGAAVAAAAGLIVSAAAAAQELPAATKKILAELNVPESILSDIDQELAVPKEWIEGAKKEGELKIVDTHADKDHARMTAPFRERYPFIKILNSRGAYQSRTTRVMIALQAGNFPTDIAMDYGGYYEQFRKADVLHDMRELPNFTKVPEQARGADGTWVAHRRQYWCTSYNTKLIKKEDLPKTWEGFLDDPRWRNGNLATGNRPQLWILMLWGYHGPDYAKRYMARLFNEVKPQLRKEGMNALVALTIAGELPLAVPSSEYRVQLSQEKGAPIGYHCPEPVPASMAEMGIFKNNPHINASRLYVNWLLSKEGQIAQYYASRSVPIHEGLQRKEFVPFAEEIHGKKIALRAPELMRQASVEVQRLWGEHWEKATGESTERTIDITIDTVQNDGRQIEFIAGENPETASLAGRTQVTIDGKKDRAAALKAGMNCKLTYRGSGSEATAVACQ